MMIQIEKTKDEQEYDVKLKRGDERYVISAVISNTSGAFMLRHENSWECYTADELRVIATKLDELNSQ